MTSSLPAPLSANDQLSPIRSSRPTSSASGPQLGSKRTYVSFLALCPVCNTATSSAPSTGLSTIPTRSNFGQKMDLNDGDVRRDLVVDHRQKDVRDRSDK